MALIDIASNKQLLVDNYLIESLTDTRQVLNPAEKVTHNPVIRLEHPWEGNYLALSHIIFDDKEQIFKMWYSSASYKAYRGADGKTVIESSKYNGGPIVCLATSKDGLYWEKPVLGLVEFQGSTENNILPQEVFMPYMFQDLHEVDPARRYKGLIRKGTTETPGMQFDLYYSPDAFQWTPYENNPVVDTSPRVGRWGPTVFMGWDPIRQVYAVHLENCLHRRCPLGKRLIGRAESPDMIHWSDPETILLPDEQDPPDTEFYYMPVIAYEGLYVGLVWIFYTTNTTHHPELVVSRDGIHYERNYRQPFIVRGPKGSFDSSCVYASAPIVHGDRILTYYTGVNWRSPETLVDLGDKGVGAIGLAITPLDGFVSVDGAKGVAVDVVSDRPNVAGFSQMVTRSFGFSGTRLLLNLRSALQQWGAGPCEVRVEILTPNHDLIEGYRFEDADPITTSGQEQVVSWNGQSDLSGLAGGPVKLRFYFKNAKLYAFQFK